MSYDTITGIWREQHGGKFRFLVEIADGKTLQRVTVTAAALRTYSGFQSAVLETAGVLFRDDQYALGRGIGSGYWADEIERHLDAAEVSP